DHREGGVGRAHVARARKALRPARRSPSWRGPPRGVAARAAREQEAMIFTDPAQFFRPPYVGQRGWVGVRIDRRLDWTLLATLVAQAYRQVAPPRLRDAVSAMPQGAPRRRRG